MAEPVRLIKRYANRKLYDTGSGELTSLRRIEELVSEGVDIRVVDHDTGEDMTSEVLVGILGKAIGAGTIEGDTVLLTSLIRAPDDLLAAVSKDEQRTEELRAEPGGSGASPGKPVAPSQSPKPAAPLTPVPPHPSNPAE